VPPRPARFIFSQGVRYVLCSDEGTGTTNARQFSGRHSGRLSRAKVFSDLSADDQDTYLKSVERTPFSQGAHFMTLAGVFDMSMHGENRDNIGWKLMGMDGPPHA
jgi:hypothetical protein